MSVGAKIRLIVTAFIVAIVYLPYSAIAGTVFWDKIQGYADNSQYDIVNGPLYLSQQPGAWVPKVSDTSDLGTYDTILPNQIVSMGGGQYNKYTTLVFDASITDRYGQAFL